MVGVGPDVFNRRYHARQQGAQGGFQRRGGRQLVHRAAGRRADPHGRESDTLSKIAKQYYGSAGQWKRIYEANKDVIKNPDLIYPGQTFKIPEA